jgi:hypothetical protein
LRLVTAGVWLACCFALTAAAEPAKRVAYDQVRVLAEETALNPTDPTQTRAGELTYAWGVRLEGAGTSRFGGISGLEVEAIAPPVLHPSQPLPRSWRRLTVISDDGDAYRWMGASDRPRPSQAVTPQRLAGLDGKPVGGKQLSDAEGLSEAGDRILVSFERQHRVWSYRRLFRNAPEPVPTPDTSDLSANRGFEAIARIPGKEGADLLALGAEDGRLWLCEGAACRLALASSPGFGWWLTGLDHLPGTGDLVAVYRFYNPFTGGFRAIIAHLPIRDGQVTVTPLAQLAPPLLTANFEGIAALEHGDGYRLYLVSDNGFSVSQSTYLLAFDWAGPEAPNKQKGPASPPAPAGKSVPEKVRPERAVPPVSPSPAS